MDPPCGEIIGSVQHRLQRPSGTSDDAMNRSLKKPMPQIAGDIRNPDASRFVIWVWYIGVPVRVIDHLPAWNWIGRGFLLRRGGRLLWLLRRTRQLIHLFDGALIGDRLVMHHVVRGHRIRDGLGRNARHHGFWRRQRGCGSRLSGGAGCCQRIHLIERGLIFFTGHWLSASASVVRRPLPGHSGSLRTALSIAPAGRTDLA